MCFKVLIVGRPTPFSYFFFGFSVFSVFFFFFFVKTKVTSFGIHDDTHIHTFQSVIYLTGLSFTLLLSACMKFKATLHTVRRGTLKSTYHLRPSPTLNIY